MLTTPLPIPTVVVPPPQEVVAVPPPEVVVVQSPVAAILSPHTIHVGGAAGMYPTAVQVGSWRAAVYHIMVSSSNNNTDDVEWVIYVHAGDHDLRSSPQDPPSEEVELALSKARQLALDSSSSMMVSGNDSSNTHVSLSSMADDESERSDVTVDLRGSRVRIVGDCVHTTRIHCNFKWFPVPSVRGPPKPAGAGPESNMPLGGGVSLQLASRFLDVSVMSSSRPMLYHHGDTHKAPYLIAENVSFLGEHFLVDTSLVRPQSSTIRLQRCDMTGSAKLSLSKGMDFDALYMEDCVARDSAFHFSGGKVSLKGSAIGYAAFEDDTYAHFSNGTTTRHLLPRDGSVLVLDDCTTMGNITLRDQSELVQRGCHVTGSLFNHSRGNPTSGIHAEIRDTEYTLDIVNETADGSIHLSNSRVRGNFTNKSALGYLKARLTQIDGVVANYGGASSVLDVRTCICPKLDPLGQGAVDRSEVLLEPIEVAGSTTMDILIRPPLPSDQYRITVTQRVDSTPPQPVAAVALDAGTLRLVTSGDKKAVYVITLTRSSL